MYHVLLYSAFCIDFSYRWRMVCYAIRFGMVQNFMFLISTTYKAIISENVVRTTDGLLITGGRCESTGWTGVRFPAAVSFETEHRITVIKYRNFSAKLFRFLGIQNGWFAERLELHEACTADSPESLSDSQTHPRKNGKNPENFVITSSYPGTNN